MAGGYIVIIRSTVIRSTEPRYPQATGSDEQLTEWKKQESVMLLTVPEELKPASQLNGWRDPIIFDTPETSDSG